MYPVLAIVIFILLIIFIIPLLILGIAGAAFSRLGFTWFEAVAVLILMLAGSLINIPLYVFRTPQIPVAGSGPVIIDAFSGEVVADKQMFTTLSLNIGGAVIPAGICGYLLYVVARLDLESSIFPLAACFLLVTFITFFTAKTIPGWGLRSPLILPALAALAGGFLLTGGSTGLSAGVAAFVGGIMGTLTGATAYGLKNRVRQGIVHISIGGSGMFGSVILCTVLAALAA